MTNETTASQPKSIGDDAQFRSLMNAWDASAPGADADRIYDEIAAYVDCRAPAAQASATIQAAPLPAERTPNSSDPRDEAHAAGWNACLAAIRSAATIQEPVMAEQFNSEVLGRVTTYLSQFPEFQPHGDDSSQQAFENIVECIERLRAAPMVADPAGVAGLELSDEGIVKVLASFGIDSTESKYGFDALQVATTVPSIRRVVETYLAATVKAVPSEALDADVIRWTKFSDGLPPEDSPIFWRDGKDYGTGYFCKEDVEHWEGEWFAAPLADKTGGGE